MCNFWNCWNYDLAEKTHELYLISNRDELHKLPVSPKLFLFLQFYRSYRLFPWCLHDVSMAYMVFTWYFLCVFCTCRAHKLAENKTILAGNQKKKKLGFFRTRGTQVCVGVCMRTVFYKRVEYSIFKNKSLFVTRKNFLYFLEYDSLLCLFIVLCFF